ncbi:hypothetical protein E2P81_ATG00959 [Venturia nashicola]|nr:hypothetical protein E2P81_ATG00959 [Venturia nashicola]
MASELPNEVLDLIFDEQLTVDFLSPFNSNARDLLAYNGRATIPNIVGLDKELFETWIWCLGFQLDFDREDRLSIVHNALTTLILSQLQNLHMLCLNYAAFSMPARSESKPPDLMRPNLVTVLQTRHLELRNLLK